MTISTVLSMINLKPQITGVSKTGYVWEPGRRPPNEFERSHFTKVILDRVPLIKHNGEVTYANVGDEFSIGPGRYRIDAYYPQHKWGNKYAGRVEPMVLLRLVRGEVIGDFQSTIERTSNGVMLKVHPTTLSQFYRTSDNERSKKMATQAKSIFRRHCGSGYERGRR